MKEHLLKIGIVLLSSVSLYAADVKPNVDASKIYHVKFSNDKGESGAISLSSGKTETWSSTKKDKDEPLLTSGVSYSFERFISIAGKPALRVKYSKTDKAKKLIPKNLFIQSLQSQIFVVSDLKLNNRFKTFDGKVLTISVRITDATGRPLAQ